MALTDPESFGQVTAPVVETDNVLLERDADSWDSAIEIVNKRLDTWKKEAKGDQVFNVVVEELKNLIIDKKEEITRTAAIDQASGNNDEDGNYIPKPSKEYTLDESTNVQGVVQDIEKRIEKWLQNVDEGLLKYTLLAIRKFISDPENKSSLVATASSVSESVLVESGQETVMPYTNGKTPAVITNGSDGAEGKTVGGAPTDTSTLPQANVEESTVVVISPIKPTSGKSLYKKGETKDFVWYKDDHSKEVTPVPREIGVKSSGITEFAPSKAKMDVDNPVPREMGVEQSGITEYNAEKVNKVDNAIPVDREEGVENSGITEYIKFEESAKYQSNLRAVLRAIKESTEI